MYEQDIHFIVLFWTVILFSHLNVTMFFLFVCLSDCKYLSFCCVSDTLAGDFLLAQLIFWGKIELCHPTIYDFWGRWGLRKLKSAKNNPHVFETKPQKFGDAKISHYMVSRQQTTTGLIRLHGCAGWSEPLLFACIINRFSHDMAHIIADLSAGFMTPAIIFLTLDGVTFFHYTLEKTKCQNMYYRNEFYFCEFYV